MLRVERPIHFHRAINGQKRISREPATVRPVETGQIPQITRLMALAIHFEQLLRCREMIDQSAIARQTNITQPRMTQIMNLLHLAPDIQEALLFLPRTISGNDPIHERMLRPVVAEMSWSRQREMWKSLIPAEN